jgi:quinol monooxygenase YgiN
VVKPGHEEAFVDAWSRLGKEAMAKMGSMRPVMLQNRDRPSEFRTFGAWLSVEAVDAFRASDLFKDAVAELQPMLESFEPMTFDEVEWA